MSELIATGATSATVGLKTTTATAPAARRHRDRSLAANLTEKLLYQFRGFPLPIWAFYSYKPSWLLFQRAVLESWN